MIFPYQSFLVLLSIRAEPGGTVFFIYILLWKSQATFMLSDRVINLLFLVGVGYLCCGTIFQKYSSTQRLVGENVKRHLYKNALFGVGNISVSLGYIYI